MNPRRFLLLLVALASDVSAADDATALRALILASDHAGLERALEAGVDPRARLPDGSLPLAWAAEIQDAAAVRALLAHGALPNDAGPGANAFGPLLVACLHPDQAVLDLLLDAGADVNARGPERLPVLSACAGHAPVAIVERMLAAGAEVDATDAAGQTPLMWAAAHAQVENFRLLTAHGADVNRQTPGGFTPLFFAIRSGDGAIADAARDAGGDVAHRAPDGTSALQLALYQGNHAFAACLVETGADLEARDQNGRQPLHAAVLAGDVGLVRTLLEAGADPSALTGPASVEWKYESNFRAGRYEWPARPALMLAAEAGDAEIMALLAGAGADTNWTTEQGDGIVHAAAGSGAPDALEAALALAPDANVRNARGETPLHRVVARVTGSALTAELEILARHGARADIANANGETAATLAADEHFKGRSAFVALFEPDEEARR